jgi:hypothetical protein
VQAFVDLIYYGEVIYQGGVQDFISDMEGLIDFSLLPINSVENLEPPPVKLDSLTLPGVHIPPIEPIAAEPVINPLPKPLTYTCSICSGVFYSRKTLKAHITGEHPQTIKCEQCNQTFGTETDLKIHCKEANHRVAADFFCTECGKTFTQDSSLRKHMKRHNPRSEMFECDICQKSCIRKDYLEEHMRTHTGKKPYKCPTCGKR